jgi:hypothetical protein
MDRQMDRQSRGKKGEEENKQLRELDLRHLPKQMSTFEQ